PRILGADTRARPCAIRAAVRNNISALGGFAAGPPGPARCSAPLFGSPARSSASRWDRYPPRDARSAADLDDVAEVDLPPIERSRRRLDREVQIGRAHV